MVDLAERLIVQTSTPATKNNRIAKLKSTGLTWRWFEDVAKGTAVEAEVAPVRLTVGKAVACNVRLLCPVNWVLAMPGWTLLVGLPLLIDCMLACGL